MASKLSEGQKELLRKYGRLYRIHHSALNKFSVEQEYESVKTQMNQQKLTHKDYEEFNRIEEYLRTANSLIKEEEFKEKNKFSGIVKVILGIIILTIGIGLSADTKFFFYGAIFVGIGLVINGGIDACFSTK